MEKSKKFYIVWNEDKTTGFITEDKQLAYECRKGSDTNCFNYKGLVSLTAQTFTDEFSNDNCTIQEIEL